MGIWALAMCLAQIHSQSILSSDVKGFLVGKSGQWGAFDYYSLCISHRISLVTFCKANHLDLGSNVNHRGKLIVENEALFSASFTKDAL